MVGSAVHPRERGEHSYFGGGDKQIGGSSPRARGTPIFWAGSFRAIRFIPASAGNTGLAHTAPAYDQVHPRERGEHNKPDKCRKTDRGSSPRARGTLAHEAERMTVARFIPASAGNTGDRYDDAAVAAVHPRERGEHVSGIYPHRPKNGSSPRARGTLCMCRQCQHKRRFIPASAGNTSLAIGT